jgi:hypothetical protein
MRHAAAVTLCRVNPLPITVSTLAPALDGRAAAPGAGAAGNPEAMGALVARRREQIDALVSVISASMERRGAPPGVSPSAVATVALAVFQGLMRQRRIDTDRVSGDLLAHGLGWLFAGLHATAGEAPLE